MKLLFHFPFSYLMDAILKKKARLRLLFSPVVFSLRPTSTQKKKHQKAIYDQLSTKLRYGVAEFFFLLSSQHIPLLALTCQAQ